MDDSAASYRGDALPSASEPASPHEAPPCPSCGASLAGKFCAQCGERRDFAPVPLNAWLGRAWASFAGLDFKLLDTLKHLLLRPGFLTEEYLQGRRIGYTKPLRLYVLISALAIGTMSLFGVLSLESWTRGAEEPLRAFGIETADDPEYQARFDKRLNIVFPLINLLSPFIFCLLLKLLYRRQFFEAHLVFSLHYFSFFVFVGLAPLPFYGLGATATAVVSLAVVLVMTLYLAVAQRRVYGTAWGQHLPRLLVLLLGILVIAQVLGFLTLIVTAASL